MARTLKVLAMVMGVGCALIGLYHFGFGQVSVPGAGASTATIDSRERFYSAIFFGFGLAWIWAARQAPVSSTVIRMLSGVFLLGGVGRLISLAVLGSPHWLQIAEMMVELLLPPVFFLLSAADERAATPARADGNRAPAA
jgi:hypothetical protein